jgi:hypothetical protein
MRPMQPLGDRIADQILVRAVVAHLTHKACKGVYAHGVGGSVIEEFECIARHISESFQTLCGGSDFVVLGHSSGRHSKNASVVSLSG